jgi:hypothetical protein
MLLSARRMIAGKAAEVAGETPERGITSEEMKNAGR